MSDPSDLATDRELIELERAIAKQRRASNDPTPMPTACDNCGEVPQPLSRYCSKDCAEDFEHRARQLRRSGVK